MACKHGNPIYNCKQCDEVLVKPPRYSTPGELERARQLYYSRECPTCKGVGRVNDTHAK